MKTEVIKSLTNDFESHAKQTENGIEFWLARDLQSMLGYADWRNFKGVISKAQNACEGAGHKASDHFVDANKTIKMPKGATKKVDDMMLTRYACYLIAQNGDPRKEKIAFAQTYFAVQTRKFELIQKRLLESERILARQKLADTEREFSKIIYEQTENEKSFGIIRSEGDKALFGYATEQMKYKWKVPPKRALADFAPTIILKAKDFATEITIFNTKEKNLKSERQITHEHVASNKSVRNTLKERGISPEELPPEEDTKKLQRKLKSDEKRGLKSPDSLKKNNT